MALLTICHSPLQRGGVGAVYLGAGGQGTETQAYYGQHGKSQQDGGLRAPSSNNQKEYLKGRTVVCNRWNRCFALCAFVFLNTNYRELSKQDGGLRAPSSSKKQGYSLPSPTGRGWGWGCSQRGLGVGLPFCIFMQYRKRFLKPIKLHSESLGFRLRNQGFQGVKPRVSGPKTKGFANERYQL